MSISGCGVRHGRSFPDVRFAAVDKAVEPGVQEHGGLQNVKHLVETVRKHDKKTRERHIREMKRRNERLLKEGKMPVKLDIRSKDGFITEIVGPLILNLPIDKPPKRMVFSFSGIQASKGVTHLRKTGLVYNNVFPDVPRDAGIVAFYLSALVDKIWWLRSSRYP